MTRCLPSSLTGFVWIFSMASLMSLKPALCLFNYNIAWHFDVSFSCLVVIIFYESKSRIGLYLLPFSLFFLNMQIQLWLTVLQWASVLGDWPGLSLKGCSSQPATINLLGAGGWACGTQHGSAQVQHISCAMEDSLPSASMADGEPRATGEPRQDSGDPATGLCSSFQIIMIFQNKWSCPSRPPLLWGQVVPGLRVLLGKLPTL